MFPNQVQGGLHFLHSTGDGYNRVQARHYDTELAKSTITPVHPMPAAPELVAISLRPILVRAAVCNMPGSRLLNPGSRQDLLALPGAFLQVKLSQAGDIFRADAQAAVTDVYPARAGFPRVGFWIPSGSNKHGCKYSRRVCPVSF